MNRPADKPTVAVSSRRIAVPAAYHPKETRVEGTRRRSMSAASRVATPPVYRPTVAKRHSAPPAPPQATASRAASAQRVASGRAGEPRAGVALPQAWRPNHGSATVQAGAPVRPKVPPVYRPGRQHGVLLPARVMKGASGWQNSSHSKLPAVRRHPIAIQRMISEAEQQAETEAEYEYDPSQYQTDYSQFAEKNKKKTTGPPTIPLETLNKWLGNANLTESTKQALSDMHQKKLPFAKLQEFEERVRITGKAKSKVYYRKMSKGEWDAAQGGDPIGAAFKYTNTNNYRYWVSSSLLKVQAFGNEAASDSSEIIVEFTLNHNFLSTALPHQKAGVQSNSDVVAVHREGFAEIGNIHDQKQVDEIVTKNLDHNLGFTQKQKELFKKGLKFKRMS